MKKLFFLAISLFVAMVGFSQERKGLWFSLDAEGSVALGLAARESTIGEQYLSLSPNMMRNLGYSYSLGLGYHINPRYGVGLGLTGLKNQSLANFSFIGAYLEGKARPFRRLQDLTVDLRLGLPLLVQRGSFNYKVKTHLSLAIGWEFHRLWKKLGVYPAIGLSWTPFTYSELYYERAKIDFNTGNGIFWGAHDLEKRRSGNALSAFLRLSILLD